MQALSRTLIVCLPLLFALYGTMHTQNLPCKCPKDKTPGRNCIDLEWSLQSSGPSQACYLLIVKNYQYSSSSTSLCQNYDSTRYLTFKVLHPKCYDSVNLTIMPWRADTGYKWRWNGSLPGGNPSFSTNLPTATPRQVIFEKIPNGAGWKPPMKRCEVDTFEVCIQCIPGKLTSGCFQPSDPTQDPTTILDMQVYFSDVNGNSWCTSEVGADYQTITPRPPRCTMGCGTCQTYYSQCNSWDISYGCDYADVMMVNDHGFPECSTETKVTLWMPPGSMKLCNKTRPLPQFRNWKTTYNPQNGTLSFTPPAGAGLAPCDTFKTRIPYCCDSGKVATLWFLDGLCGPEYFLDTVFSGAQIVRIDTVYLPGDNMNTAVGTNTTFGKLGCDSCTFGGDRAKWVNGSCDTIWFYNGNSTSSCINDGTGNKRWQKLEVDVPLNCTGIYDFVNQPPGWVKSITTDPITRIATLRFYTTDSSKAVGGCDSIGIRICCSVLNKITWRTYDIVEVIITQDTLIQPDPAIMKLMPWKQEISTVSKTGFTLGTPLPNPTTAGVTIPVNLQGMSHNTQRAIVRVYTATGEIVSEIHQNVQGGQVEEITLDGSRWIAGTYLVKVEVEGATATTTFVVQR